MAAESSLKPSDPGCLMSDMANGSSTANTALKLTSPNARARVSGWALSWWSILDWKSKRDGRLLNVILHNEMLSLENKNTHKNLESIQQWRGVCQASKFKLGRVIFGYISIGACAEEHLLDATEERISQVLHRVHHDTAVYCITWGKTNVKSKSYLFLKLYCHFCPKKKP